MKNEQLIFERNIVENLNGIIENNRKNNIRIWKSETIGNYTISDLTEEQREYIMEEIFSYYIKTKCNVWDLQLHNKTIVVLI